jgi:hypothetical protein
MILKITKIVGGVVSLLLALLFALSTRDMFRYLVFPKFRHPELPAYIEGHLLQTWQVFALTSGYAIAALGLSLCGLFLLFRRRHAAA